jgi:hypothetical protein
MPEDTLKASNVQIERKCYDLVLKENAKGRFVRITESGGQKRNSIIVSAAGLKRFQKVLAEMVTAAEEIPAKTEPVQDQP